MEQISAKLIPLIFLSGGVGASLRYVLSMLMNGLTGKIWSGTLFVNIIGSTIFFLLAKHGVGKNELYVTAIRTGLLGALTTFSTFSFELVSLIKTGRYLEAGLVAFLNIFTGIIIGIFILR